MSFSSNIFIVHVNKNKTYNSETLKTAGVEEVNIIQGWPTCYMGCQNLYEHYKLGPTNT